MDVIRRLVNSGLGVAGRSCPAYSVERNSHSAWRDNTTGATYLMGGYNTFLFLGKPKLNYETSIDTVSTSGSVGRPSWTMEYDTKWACLISRGDTFVITGGHDGDYISRVSLYSSAGWVRNLASLNTARSDHGCASYTDSNGQEVLLVAGGDTTGTGSTTLATTEILRTIDGRWTMAGNLPDAVYGLSGATLANTVFMTGGYANDNYYSTILRYDASNDVWTTAGQMREKRRYHAVAVVDRDTVEDRCY